MPTQCCRFKSCVRPSYSMIILVVNHACIDRPPFLFIDRLARLHQASQRIDACSSPSLVDSSLQFQPRYLAGGWVNEQLCFSIFLISGAPVAAILIQQWLGRLHSFFFLQGGWCVIWEHRGRRYGCSSGGRHVSDQACCHAVKGPRYARLRPLEYLFLTHICI